MLRVDALVLREEPGLARGVPRGRDDALELVVVAEVVDDDAVPRRIGEPGHVLEVPRHGAVRVAAVHEEHVAAHVREHRGERRHAWRTLRPRQVLDPYWGTAWYSGLVGGAGEEARAMNPFAFESEQVLGIVLRRAGLAVRVVPDLRYTVVRAASSKAFHAAPFRGRFFGAKCMLGTTAPPWPPDGLDTVAASYFASWETSDRLYRWPDGFDHVEPFAGAPPPPAATVVTARHRLANGTRVSLYAAGYVARSQA